MWACFVLHQRVCGKRLSTFRASLGMLCLFGLFGVEVPRNRHACGCGEAAHAAVNWWPVPFPAHRSPQVHGLLRYSAQCAIPMFLQYNFPLHRQAKGSYLELASPNTNEMLSFSVPSLYLAIQLFSNETKYNPQPNPSPSHEEPSTTYK